MHLDVAFDMLQIDLRNYMMIVKDLETSFPKCLLKQRFENFKGNFKYTHASRDIL